MSDPNLAGIVVYTPVINGEICYSIQKYSVELVLFVFLLKSANSTTLVNMENS